MTDKKDASDDARHDEKYDGDVIDKESQKGGGKHQECDANHGVNDRPTVWHNTPPGRQGWKLAVTKTFPLSPFTGGK